MAHGLLQRMGMEFLYEKIDLYRRAVDLADRIYKFADELPRGQWDLADQFKREAMSISLIMAEGRGEWHPNERRDFFLTTRGSAHDCLPLLEQCLRQKLIGETECMKLKGELDFLARMLSALIKGLDESREQ